MTRFPDLVLREVRFAAHAAGVTSPNRLQMEPGPGVRDGLVEELTARQLGPLSDFLRAQECGVQATPRRQLVEQILAVAIGEMHG
jgi:hypothetical protein